MNVFRPISLFFVFLLCIALFASSCSKKSSAPEPIPEEPVEVVVPVPEIQELDITNLGKLTVSAENSGGANALEGSSKLVDDKPGTKFLTSAYTKDFYIQMAFPEAKQIGSYTLTTANDGDDRDPQIWTVTASVDGAEWVELSSQTYEFFPERGEKRQYFFVNPKAYKLYRFNVKSIRGGNTFQLAEFRLTQVPTSKQRNTPVSKVETIVEGKNTLIFVDKSPNLDATVKAGLINVFKVNYQKMADVYNPAAKTTVVFVIEPKYKGVAATWSGQVIRYDPTWFVGNPRDLDVATHELMHVIQSYPGLTDAGWAVEGVADYVRHTMGLTNVHANWSLGNYSSGQTFRDAYRPTARFFLWLEGHGYPGLVIKLDKSMRSGEYRTPTFWVANTGKTVDQLWADYSANPAL